MSINIDKALWKTAIGENTWPLNVSPLNTWVVHTGKGAPVSRWWPTSTYFEMATYQGVANDNECQYYCLSEKFFNFGTYQAVAIISDMEISRWAYPLMFETALGGSAITSPPGATEKAGHILFQAKDDFITQVLTGYDGYGEAAIFTGWTTSNQTTLKFVWATGSVNYYVNGALKVTHTTYVPQDPLPYTLEIWQNLKATEYTNPVRMFVKNFAEL